MYPIFLVAASVNSSGFTIHSFRIYNRLHRILGKLNLAVWLNIRNDFSCLILFNCESTWAKKYEIHDIRAYWFILTDLKNQALQNTYKN